VPTQLTVKIRTSCDTPSSAPILPPVPVPPANATVAVNNIEPPPITFENSTGPKGRRRGKEKNVSPQTCSVSHQEQFDFQRRAEGLKGVTFESLKNHPQPHLRTELDFRTRETAESLANGTDLKALIYHAAVCRAELHECPKIKALCNAIQSIRDSSLEAKICVFSSYARALDDDEEAQCLHQFHNGGCHRCRGRWR
jgi:hypothetical protein